MKSKGLLLLRIISAAIMLQTLFFKFTGAKESVFIFSTLGAEPWGRWASGIFELVASVLILLPATQVLGALLAVGLMSGATLAHIFVLGVVVEDDGGLLFALALVVLLASSIVLAAKRSQLLSLFEKVELKVRRKLV